MFNFDEKNLYHNEHKGTFPPEKPRYTMTEEVENMVRYMRETIERLLRFEEKLNRDFQDISSHLTNDNVIFKNTMNNSFTTFLQEVKNEINSFESNMESSISLFQKNIETNYSTLSEDCKQQIAENLHTFTDKVIAFENGITTAFNEYKTELNATYDAFRTATESRLEQYNSNYTSAFNDYVTSMNKRLSDMERSFNQAYATFTTEINNNIQTFETEWTKTVEERLDGQDSMISDAVLYMRTNLNATLSNILYDMKENGALTGVIESEVVSTPFHYGAVGDGVTDDSEALQTAIDNGNVIDLVGKTFKITRTITLHSNLVVRNGFIIGENIGNIFVLIGTNDEALKNVTIENVSFNGSDNCNTGFYARYCEGVIVNNCSFSNLYGETDASYGVHLRECKNSFVLHSKFDTIEAKIDGSIGNGVGSSRGVLFTDTIESVIENCVFDNIISTDDSDAIHIASSVNTMQKFFGNVTIRNNVFKNVGRSAIKLQQSGVIIDNNEFVSTNTLEYFVRSYASNVIVKNNKFIGVSQIPIYIGSNNVDLYENHLIEGNTFEGSIVDYQGCVCVGDDKHAKDLIVKNNKAVLTENTYFVYLRGWVENLNVTDNIVDNCNCVVYFRKPSTDTDENNVNKNYVVCNNIGSCYWYVARFDECVTLYEGIIVSGNIFKYLVAQSLQYRYTAYLQGKVYSKYPLIVNNNVSCVTGASIYDGYIKKDVLSLRPTQGVKTGDVYYDTESEKFWYCVTPAKYDETGALTTEAEWI